MTVLAASIHLYIHTSIHIYIYTPIHLYVRTSIHLYIYTSIHLYVHTSIHLYIYTSIHPYIYASIHPYIHTCIHRYIHTSRHSYIITSIPLYIHTSIHLHRADISFRQLYMAMAFSFSLTESGECDLQAWSTHFTLLLLRASSERPHHVGAGRQKVLSSPPRDQLATLHCRIHQWLAAAAITKQRGRG